MHGGFLGPLRIWCFMRDFSDGVQLSVTEDDYQTALQEYCDGLVVNLSRNRKGQFTLHKVTCGTLSYDLVEKDSPTPQTHHCGKVLFRNQGELDAWLATRSDLELGALNR